MSKWAVMKWNAENKPWRVWAPAGYCRGRGTCRCRNFNTWVEAMEYVGQEL